MTVTAIGATVGRSARSKKIRRVGYQQGAAILMTTRNNVAPKRPFEPPGTPLEHGRIAMDLAVVLSRPRHRGDLAAAAIEGHVLGRLLGR
ncbi:MAG TPA: hypothetical protein VN702_19825 [Acetobacteraceae bacterium]|nr:hypothetical protein [Acetobacteraceae bacterium]